MRITRKFEHHEDQAYHVGLASEMSVSDKPKPCGVQISLKLNMTETSSQWVYVEFQIMEETDSPAVQNFFC